MAAYFYHHLSDKSVDLSDLYVVLSGLCVDLSDLYVDLSMIHYTPRDRCSEKTTLGNNVYLSDHYVDLSENYVDLSENYVDLSENNVDLSDIKLTSRWQLGTFTCYKNKI